MGGGHNCSIGGSDGWPGQGRGDVGAEVTVVGADVVGSGS